MSFWDRITGGWGRGAGGTPRGKPGARAYAVGDIHGRLDLLDELLGMIERDLETDPPEQVFLVFLGDLIDRGPDSKGVVERLRQLRLSGGQIVFLSGNHEEVLLRVLAGEPGVFDDWMRFGGRECVLSYGVDPRRLQQVDEDDAAALLRRAIPPEHIEFIESFGDTFLFGDYLFVHAGIRPGVPLEEQAPHDLRWIRQPFLRDAKEHGFMVVHGHTVVDQVEEKSNRIGIDTGACATGVLTAIVVEGANRRYLATA